MEDLTKIDGIGKATAAKLNGAGIASIAALASANPETPPEGISPEDWAKWIASAQEAASTPPEAKTGRGPKAGPVLASAVRFGGRSYAKGNALPADVPDAVLKRLRELGAIEQ